jgi:P-type Ca2+ transporter type 2C
VIEELLRAFSARSTVKTIWQVGLFSNMRLVLVVLASFALQLAIHDLPALQRLFGTAPISFRQCVTWMALGAVPLTVLELGKRMRRGQRLAEGA